MKIFASDRPDEVQKLERHTKKTFQDIYFLRTSTKIVIRTKIFIFGNNANDIDLIALFIILFEYVFFIVTRKIINLDIVDPTLVKLGGKIDEILIHTHLKYKLLIHKAKESRSVLKL